MTTINKAQFKVLAGVSLFLITGAIACARSPQVDQPIRQIAAGVFVAFFGFLMLDIGLFIISRAKADPSDQFGQLLGPAFCWTGVALVAIILIFASLGAQFWLLFSLFSGLTFHYYLIHKPVRFLHPYTPKDLPE